MRADLNVEWSQQALSLWAKSGDQDGYLRLPQHLIDTAAVAERLWDTWVSPRTKQYLRDSLSLEDVQCRQLLAWFAGTHDVGKASRAFALMLEAKSDYRYLTAAIEEAGLDLVRPVAQSQRYHHTAASQTIIFDWLASRFNTRGRVPQSLAEISGAHHGLPAFPENVIAAERDLAGKHGPLWGNVHKEILDNITALTDAEQVLSIVMSATRPISTDVQMVLTGLVIMADWIASNGDAFPMVGGGAYDPKRVETGMSAIGLTGPWRPPEHRNQKAQQAYRASFGWSESRAPRPMQETVLDVARKSEGPTLMCVEAPMGNGKTEAALLAAEILAALTNASGVMFAAPTMATSDALFSTVVRWARAVTGENVTSTYLGHSKNLFNQEFNSLPRADSIRTYLEDDGANVVAHDWLWGRKKGILANMVVGTVDQVLVMALQSKHAMLRHLGLSGKVVVIDEVHAYDVYMSSYLARALFWLGAYGAPVILLSATLPHDLKAQLVTAYWDGVDRSRVHSPEEIPVSGSAYPAITTVRRSGTELVPVEPDSEQLRLKFRAIRDDEWTSLVRPIVDEGGCVLIICNTVNRAQEAYSQAKRLVGDDARLLHARFTAAERVVAERNLVEELGPDSNRQSGRPHRRVVVATQVVEQSLDLDFDLIVSDIAPIDLLLQRAGRLHRHARPAEDRPQWLQEPRMFVRGFAELGSETAPPTFARGMDSVYPHSLLLETYVAAELGEAPKFISLPADIPSLVQKVYGNEVEIPGPWSDAYDKACKELEKAKKDARDRATTFQFPGPSRSGFAKLWKNQTSDIGKNDQTEARGYAQVRDSDPTLEVVICQSTAVGTYRPLPWIGRGYEDMNVFDGQVPDPKIAFDLATSTVRLPYVFSTPRVFERALDELERRTDLAWLDSGFLHGQLQLTLDKEYRTELAGYSLRYDRELGLIQEDEQKPTDGRED